MAIISKNNGIIKGTGNPNLDVNIQDGDTITPLIYIDYSTTPPTFYKFNDNLASGSKWEVDVLVLEKDKVLQKVDEGNGFGITFNERDQTKFGTLGLNAIDLSEELVSTSSTSGDELLPISQWNAKCLATKKYNVYSALISQSGTTAPTATILENTLGFTPTWGYANTGTYILSSSGEWTGNEFVISSYGGVSGVTVVFDFVREDSDTNDLLFKVYTVDPYTEVNGSLISASLEIRQYI